MKTTVQEITKKISTFLVEERGNTDVSLNAERGKTDDSLFDLRKKAERETDATVKSDRQEADLAKALVRTDRDHKSKTKNSELSNDRIMEDKTMATERSKVDAAIHLERTEKARALVEFLQSEREETDGNLSHERSQTDIAVDESSKLLKDEMTQHTKTKAELTTREDLLAIVSHDLKNPVGSILSCTEMLLEDPSFKGMNTELKYWIELIKRNAETSLRLIGDILDMERIAEGKLELLPKVQSLSQVVREAIEPFVHQAATNRILLRVAPTEKEILLSFDRDRINQVLSNLISNALKFTPEGGSIVIKVEPSKLETIVAVCDTGVGIPDDKKDIIFKRYAQIGKKDRRGLGLGLYISKMLIEAHNGRLWVTSKPGQGSTFYFSLLNE